jgi:hypothetical protein
MTSLFTKVKQKNNYLYEKKYSKNSYSNNYYQLLKKSIMKKNFTLIAMLMFILTNMTAQTYLHQDNFNSAAVDATVSSLGYTLGQVGTIQAADAAGNNGSQFVKITQNGANMSLKSPAITNFVVGKNYTLEVKTNVPSAKNRTPYVWIVGGTRPGGVLGGSIVSAIGWTKSTYTFKLLANETEFRVGVYSGNNNTVDLYVDDLMLYEDQGTSVSDVNVSSVKVVKNLLGGEYRIIGDEIVRSYSIYNMNGQLIMQSNNLNSQDISVNLNNLSKGIYIFKITDKNSQNYIQKVLNQ